ncbi:MAG TPA: 3D domain-containing protein [Pyrinomonadaceae bacterium]|jgi:3D (Asp-Asp-Asp) domain-containing protein
MQSIFSGSALACTALLAGSLALSARPLSAETVIYGTQVQTQKPVPVQAETSPSENVSAGSVGEAASQIADTPIATGLSYIATAYSLRGRTASGLLVSKGLIAADPRLLPLGSRVRLDAGAYSGEYLVADTGSAVRGRHIDIWIPTGREAMRFGRRAVKLTILSYGGKRKAAHAKAR